MPLSWRVPRSLGSTRRRHAKRKMLCRKGRKNLTLDFEDPFGKLARAQHTSKMESWRDENCRFSKEMLAYHLAQTNPVSSSESFFRRPHAAAGPSFSSARLWTSRIGRSLDFLGNSGIKFEVEGEGGSTGADTYIPLQKSGTFFIHFSQKIQILQHFSENFRKFKSCILGKSRKNLVNI